MIGNGKCDEVCNNRGCAYDFGDCLLNQNSATNKRRLNSQIIQ